MKEKWNSKNCNVKLDGKVAIITGANSGIGYQTALDLAGRNCHVIMACRSKERGQKAVDEIMATYPNAKVQLEIVDLMDLDSVVDFANRTKQNFSHIDFLINNAGIMFPPLQRTKQGFESQIGTNHLAHFCLTLNLLPIITNQPSRIINISSMAHKLFEYLNIDDLSWENTKYNPQKAYGQSKLANLMFSAKLTQVLKNTNVIVASAHPGITNTNLAKGTLGLLSFLFQSAFFGAQPMLYAILEDDVKAGDFFGPDGLKGIKGSPMLCQVMAKTYYTQQNIDKLWDLSLKLTNTKFEI